MRNWSKIVILCILLISLLSKMGRACTTFCLDHGAQPVFGRNYDWMVGDGLLIINKRGVTKTAQSRPVDQPLTWTSKYGSATFNQYGREFPMGGMNEAGLVVETMLLDETEYPLPDSRPAVTSLQWIQYQLDNHSSVEEVIASDAHIRIRRSTGPGCHFLVCDRTGHAAAIEFIGRKLVYHTQARLPVKTLTNSTYSASIRFFKKNEIPQADKYNSIKRFIRAAHMVANYDPQTAKTPIDYAFNILNRVAHPFYTQWRIVYDVADLSIYFGTLGNQQVRHFSLKSFDFSCATPVQVLDVNADLWGDIAARFSEYTPQMNRNLIGDAFGKTYFLNHLEDHVLDEHSRYPESTFCSESSK